MRTALACLAASVGICFAACSSSSKLPTAKVGPFPDGSLMPLEVVVKQIRKECPRRSGQARLDLRQGDTHLRPVFECSIVRDNPPGAAAELVAMVEHRHDAGHRADQINAVAAELGIKGYGRSALIWSIGTGVDGCYRVADAVFHAQELASAARSTHESPVQWTKAEAARLVGMCPEQLDAFFNSVAQAGQPAAATAVRKELVRLNALPRQG